MRWRRCQGAGTRAVLPLAGLRPERAATRTRSGCRRSMRPTRSSASCAKGSDRSHCSSVPMRSDGSRSRSSPKLRPCPKPRWSVVTVEHLNPTDVTIAAESLHARRAREVGSCGSTVAVRAALRSMKMRRSTCPSSALPEISPLRSCMRSAMRSGAADLCSTEFRPPANPSQRSAESEPHRLAQRSRNSASNRSTDRPPRRIRRSSPSPHYARSAPTQPPIRFAAT